MTHLKDFKNNTIIVSISKSKAEIYGIRFPKGAPLIQLNPCGPGCPAFMLGGLALRQRPDAMSSIETPDGCFVPSDLGLAHGKYSAEFDIKRGALFIFKALLIH